MSTNNHHPGHPGGRHPHQAWYKIFSGTLIALAAVFLAKFSLCFDKHAFLNLNLIFDNLSCAGYGLGVLLCLIVGLLPMLVGLEQAKKHRNPGGIYRLLIVLYVLGLAGFLGILFTR